MARTTHVVPTHVRTPETVISFGGISLSAKQFLLMLLGAGVGYDLWQHLRWLRGTLGGMLLAALLALLPAICAMILAFAQVAGRALPIWLLVMGQFRLRKRRLIWQTHPEHKTEQGDIDA